VVVLFLLLLHEPRLLGLPVELRVEQPTQRVSPALSGSL
jgi:hypothetical protein